VGRYAIFDQIAAGGMATVHLARLVGSAGFSRVVAAKRMHRHFLQDPDLRQMFLVEAQLAARILHPNVVPILDVLSHDDELIIVMDYVHGESLHALLRASCRAKKAIPLPIGCAVLVAVLHGLHAAHEARNERGEPLGIVHRDVSPQNVLVGADGVARVLDFGIAKAIHAQNQTNPGSLKGKFSYMAPEVVNGSPITRQADVFSAGIVLWEVLTGRMLFKEATEQERLMRIVSGRYPSARQLNPAVSPALEWALGRALQLDTKARYSTALEFAIEIERAVSLASQRVVGDWVRQLAADALDKREDLIHAIEVSNVVQQRQWVVPPASSLTTPASSIIDELIANSLANTPPATLARAALSSAERLISDVPANTGPTTPTTYTVMTGESPSAVKAMNARRRRLASAVAVAALAVIGAVVVVRLVAARSSPGDQNMPSTRPTTTALPPIVVPIPSAPLAPRSPDLPSAATVAQIPVPPNAARNAPSGETTSSPVLARPMKSQHAPRRVALSPRAPTSSTVHAKHYLPSEL
jgi:serine/threonine-protein kinase